MKRSASARSHNAKDTRITNYKAEELFELLYRRDDDGDCLSLSTRQVARALTFGGARAPTLRRNQSFPSGDFWTDPKWLHAQLQEMDLKIESRSLRQGSERTPRSRGAVAEAEARAAAEDEAREREAEEAAAATRPMSADVVRQQRAMARLTAKSLKTLRLTKHALHERHALVSYGPMVSSFRKLGEAAITFKSGGADGGYERALNGEIMSPTRFDIFLRQVFNLALSPEELGAVVRWMDADGNQFIDATEFLREFWKFGKLEHMRRDAENARRRRASERRAREHRADWMTRFTHVTPAHVTETFTKRDFESAERALANAAADHDQNSVHARAIREVFEGPPMPPSDFAEAIRRNWHVRLQPPELAALVGTYDDNGNGVVDGSEFYRYFTTLGRKERQRRLDQSNHEHHVRTTRALKLQNKAMRAFGAKRRDVKVVWPEDVQKKHAVRRDGRGRVGWVEGATAQAIPPSPVKTGHRPRSAPARRAPKVLAA